MQQTAAVLMLLPVSLWALSNCSAEGGLNWQLKGQFVIVHNCGEGRGSDNTKQKLWKFTHNRWLWKWTSINGISSLGWRADMWNQMKKCLVGIEISVWSRPLWEFEAGQCVSWSDHLWFVYCWLQACLWATHTLKYISLEGAVVARHAELECLHKNKSNKVKYNTRYEVCFHFMNALLLL